MEFDQRERALLALACAQVDTVAALETAVAADGLIVGGSRDQRIVHPAALEARQGRLTVLRLLGQIGMVDEAGMKPETAASRRARKAAQARWNKRDELALRREELARDA